MRTVVLVPLAGTDLGRFVDELDAAVAAKGMSVSDGSGARKESLKHVFSRGDVAAQPREFTLSRPDGTPPDANWPVRFRFPGAADVESLLSEARNRAADAFPASIIAADALVVLAPGTPGEQSHGNRQLKDLLQVAVRRATDIVAPMPAVTVAGGHTLDSLRELAGGTSLDKLELRACAGAEAGGDLAGRVLDEIPSTVAIGVARNRAHAQPFRLMLVAASTVGAILIGAVYMTLSTGGERMQKTGESARVERALSLVEENADRADAVRVLADVAAELAAAGDDASVTALRAKASAYASRALDDILGSSGALRRRDYENASRIVSHLASIAPEARVAEAMDGLRTRISRDFAVTDNLTADELSRRRDDLVEVGGALSGLSQWETLKPDANALYGGVAERLLHYRIRDRMAGMRGAAGDYRDLAKIVSDHRAYRSQPLALPTELDARLAEAGGFLTRAATGQVRLRILLREVEVVGDKESMKNLFDAELDPGIQIEIRSEDRPDLWMSVRNVDGESWDNGDVEAVANDLLDGRMRLRAVIPEAQRGATEFRDVPWSPGQAVRVTLWDEDKIRNDKVAVVSSDAPGYAASPYYLPGLSTGLFEFLGREKGVAISSASAPIAPKDVGNTRLVARVRLVFEVTHEGRPYLTPIPELLREAVSGRK